MQRIKEFWAGDGGGRQIARGDQPAFAVNVGQDQLQELGALLDSLCDFAPLTCLDE